MVSVRVDWRLCYMGSKTVSLDGWLDHAKVTSQLFAE